MLSPMKVRGPSTQDDISRLLQLAGSPDSSPNRLDRDPRLTPDSRTQKPVVAAQPTTARGAPIPGAAAVAVHPAEEASQELAQPAQQPRQPPTPKPPPPAPSSGTAAKAHRRAAAEDTQEATLTALLMGVVGAVTVAVLLCSSLLLLPTRAAYRYVPPSDAIGFVGGGAPGSLQRIREQELASLKDIEEPPDDDAEATRRHGAGRASAGGAGGMPGGGGGGGGGSGNGGNAGPSRPTGDASAKAGEGGHRSGGHAHHGEPSETSHTS